MKCSPKPKKGEKKKEERKNVCSMENKQRPNGTGSTEGESALNTLEKEGCAIQKVKNSINMRSSVDFHF